MWFSTETTFNVCVFHRSQIQFKEKITLFTLVLLSNNYMSSLRTTTCDALFVPIDMNLSGTAGLNLNLYDLCPYTTRLFLHLYVCTSAFVVCFKFLHNCYCNACRSGNPHLFRSDRIDSIMLMLTLPFTFFETGLFYHGPVIPFTGRMLCALETQFPSLYTRIYFSMVLFIFFRSELFRECNCICFHLQLLKLVYGFEKNLS